MQRSATLQQEEIPNDPRMRETYLTLSSPSSFPSTWWKQLSTSWAWTPPRTQWVSVGLSTSLPLLFETQYIKITSALSGDLNGGSRKWGPSDSVCFPCATSNRTVTHTHTHTHACRVQRPTSLLRDDQIARDNRLPVQ